jgi:hypothetical protein
VLIREFIRFICHGSAGQNGKVIAFEAQPELKKYLSDVKQAFALDNLEIVRHSFIISFRCNDPSQGKYWFRSSKF